MNKLFAVAKWEYLEKVKTKAFIISLILTPAIIIAISILPTLLADQEETVTKAVGIMDPSGIYFNKISSKLDNFKLENGQPNYIAINLYNPKQSFDELKSEADKKVLENNIEGYLLIKNGGTDSVGIEFRSKSTGNFRDLRVFEDVFNEVRVNLKLNAAGIDPSIMVVVQKDIDINAIKIEEGGKESSTEFLTVFFSSLVFILLLMMMVIYSGQMLVRSLVEEKANKLIEILVSSCTANELLAGKIIGLSLLGLTQVFIWVLIGIAVAGAAIVPPAFFENILPILVYFLLGFVFYTAIFVGIGSIVTTEQEAQQITSYLSLVLVLPIVFAMAAIQNPDAMFVKVLSYIPLTSPSIMMLRVNVAPVPPIELFVTIGIMLVSIYVTIFIAAKIFRIGILSYGKKPNLHELFQWIKEK